jgi:hypothetical protein
MKREKMDAKFFDFVATLTPMPELVKRLRETVESVRVERYREVDAPGCPSCRRPSLIFVSSARSSIRPTSTTRSPRTCS